MNIVNTLFPNIRISWNGTILGLHVYKINRTNAVANGFFYNIAFCHEGAYLKKNPSTCMVFWERRRDFPLSKHIKQCRLVFCEKCRSFTVFFHMVKQQLLLAGSFCGGKELFWGSRLAGFSIFIRMKKIRYFILTSQSTTPF